MGRTVRFRSSDKEGAVIRPAISQTRLSGKVAKIFPIELFILTKGFPSVNGKSVPFAHLRKGSGYPGQRSRRVNLFLLSHTLISFIQPNLLAWARELTGIRDASTRTSSLVPSESPWRLTFLRRSSSWRRLQPDARLASVYRCLFSSAAPTLPGPNSSSSPRLLISVLLGLVLPRHTSSGPIKSCT